MWIVFDVDGVLIDTSESYDMATKLTVEYFLSHLGIKKEVSLEIIRDMRKKGVFSDDFELSEALILMYLSGEDLPKGEGVEYLRQKLGIVLDRKDIERVFNTFYLGEIYPNSIFKFEGLWRKEKRIVDIELLKKAKETYKLGIVTGRDSLEMKLAEEIIRFKFDKVVTRDMFEKPDPRALYEVTQGEEAIYIGDSKVDEELVERYRRTFKGNVTYLMVGRDVNDVNEALKKSF